MGGPSEKTVKRLFALSRNKCAYPKCVTPIVHTSGTVLGDICHIKAESPGGPRFDPLQSDTARHSFENLLLLCNVHHRIVDADVRTYPIELLYEIKELHERQGDIELSKATAEIAAKLFAASQLSIHASGHAQVMVDSPGAVQANQVVFKSPKRRLPSVVPLVGAIGHNLNKRNYTLHLIERFNEFQDWDSGKAGKGKFSIMYRAIKKEFGTKWDFVPEARFTELTAYIQKRILNTKLGRIKNSREERCFSTWEEWLLKQGI